MFSDQNFAKALEQDPEKALHDAGYKLNEAQLNALRSSSPQAANVAADVSVAAFVRAVVSVLTKGTQPAVQVVVSSAVVASAARTEDER